MALWSHSGPTKSLHRAGRGGLRPPLPSGDVGFSGKCGCAYYLVRSIGYRGCFEE